MHVQLDVRQGLDTVDQILRHRIFECAPHDQMKCLDLRRQKDDGLACRIAAANQDDLFAGAKFCLDRRGPIGNAVALETVNVGDVRSPVASAGCDDDTAGRHRFSTVEFERQHTGVIFRRDQIFDSDGRTISAPNLRA